MSKVAIQGAATGTGVFTLASPATNTDRTLVLPDEAGTVLTTAGVPASAMPAGSVLQVVSNTYTTSTSITSGTKGSGTETGLQVTITPISASNKFLIFGHVAIYLNYTTNAGAALEIHDGSSIVYTQEQWAAYGNGDGEEDYHMQVPFHAFITPSSSGAITYKVRAWKNLTVTAQAGGIPSTISILEIAQ